MNLVEEITNYRNTLESNVTESVDDHLCPFCHGMGKINTDNNTWSRIKQFLTDTFGDRSE